MPLYEYYCRDCDGIFEVLRPMNLASHPAPCPACEKEGQRIMPTSFEAFTLREGYPRKIPDKGTYWHLGKEVKQRVSAPFRPWEHPEVNKPEPPKRKLRGEASAEKEKERAREKEFGRMRASGVQPADYKLPKKLQ